MSGQQEGVKEQPILTEADLPKRDPYEVAGYGVKTPGYDGPYLDGHDFDPGFTYAMAGNPKSQAKFQKELKELKDASDTDDHQSGLTTSDSGVVVTTEGPIEVTDLSAGSELRKEILYGEGVDVEDTKLKNRLTDDDPRNPTNYETKPVDNADALEDSEPTKGSSEALPTGEQPDNYYDLGEGPKKPTEF